MRIEDVSTVSLGYETGHVYRSFALVRIETDDGLVGYGEASTNWGHAYPEVVASIVTELLRPVLIRRDPLQIRARLREMQVTAYGYLGWEGVATQAIGAVEIALWDLLGKATGQPVSRLLGAGRSRLELYGTGTTMFDEPPEWHCDYFDRGIDHGFGAVKLRLGRGVRDDVRFVQAIRDHVGPDVTLMVDAYWGYSAHGAVRLAQALHELDVLFFEEPVPQHQATALRDVARSSPIPIAVGERVYSPAQFEHAMDHLGVRVVEPDAQICGGILACLAVTEMAERRGVLVIPHIGGPSPVGLAANLHWAAASECPLFEYDLDPFQPLLDALVTGPSPFAFEAIGGGAVSVPDGPGLGIDVDEDAFARFPHRRGATYTDIYPEHEAGRLD